MLRSLPLALLTLLLGASPASAQGVSLEFRDGYVTLSAQNATVRQILAEWARQGQTHVVNADRVTGGPVTLELERVPEKRALETVLRAASGYLASARPPGEPGASVFGRILVMPPSTARPAAPAPAPQPVAQPGMGRPPFNPGGMPAVVDDQDAPVHGPPGFVPDQDDVQPEPSPDGGEGPQAPGFVPGMRGGFNPNVPDPNAAEPPPPPGPTPMTPGAVTSPTPGVLPVPEQPQPAPQPPPQ